MLFTVPKKTYTTPLEKAAPIIVHTDYFQVRYTSGPTETPSAKENVRVMLLVHQESKWHICSTVSCMEKSQHIKRSYNTNIQ
jgi:hypothetical protein